MIIRCNYFNFFLIFWFKKRNKKSSWGSRFGPQAVSLASLYENNPGARKLVPWSLQGFSPGCSPSATEEELVREITRCSFWFGVAMKTQRPSTSSTAHGPPSPWHNLHNPIVLSCPSSRLPHVPEGNLPSPWRGAFGEAAQGEVHPGQRGAGAEQGGGHPRHLRPSQGLPEETEGAAHHLPPPQDFHAGLRCTVASLREIMRTSEHAKAQKRDRESERKKIGYTAKKKKKPSIIKASHSHSATLYYYC